jgi:hyaluronan synthase
VTAIPAGQHPYTGPRTGDFDASLEAIALMEGEFAAVALAPALPYTGPRTGDQLAVTEEEPAGRNPRRPGIRAVIAAGVITGTVLGIVIGLHAEWLPGGSLVVRLGWYGSAVSLLIGAKLLMSLLAAPVRDTPAARAVLARQRIAAVVTCRNEDPAAFRRCLESLLAQTRLPASVTVVDDASDRPDCKLIALSMVPDFAALGTDLELITFTENLGKREALAAAWRTEPEAFAYLCIDSDTILAPDAVERLLRPMASRTVQAVTGCVLAANRDRNLLTRLIDLRYAYAFLGERAAYSVLGSVLCVCGSLALWRGTTARRYLGSFTGQTFLGQRCTYGDDRHMTFWALKQGRVVLAPDAVAWTLVPYRMGHFLRQQARWSKSFFRESLWVLFRMSPLRACWWLTLTEAGTWIGFTGALLYSLIAVPVVTGHFAPVTYLASVLLLSYARAGHYAEASHPGMTRRSRVGTLLLAPLYGIIHVTLLLPLRVYALATLRDNNWGTRKQVEVGA